MNMAERWILSPSPRQFYSSPYVDRFRLSLTTDGSLGFSIPTQKSCKHSTQHLRHVLGEIACISMLYFHIHPDEPMVSYLLCFVPRFHLQLRPMS